MAKFTYAQEIWDDVQRDYEFGTSVNKLGQHYGISRQAIMSKAKRFKWQKPSAGNASAQDATGEGIVQTNATAPVVEQVASAIAESGDLRAALIMTHREEWVEIDFIRTEAMKAFKDHEFKPEDAGPKWDARSRLSYASKLISSYNTAANALLVKQEGQRRAHGFDYKTQIAITQETAQADIDKQAEIERLIDIYERAVRTANGTLIQEDVTDA